MHPPQAKARIYLTGLSSRILARFTRAYTTPSGTLRCGRIFLGGLITSHRFEEEFDAVKHRRCMRI